MRIALVASLVSPIREVEANGPHSVIIDLARGLSDRGHEVAVYAAYGSSASGVTIRGIEVDPLVVHAAIDSDGAARVSSDVQRAVHNGFSRLFDEVKATSPDIVSQHAFDAPAIRLAERLPVIHTLHLPPIQADVVAAARATWRPIATVSNAMRKAWQRAGVSEVMVLRNGVPHAVSDEHPRTRDVCLIAGRVSPEKGTHTAIRVARRAGFEPLVVGDIYDARYFRDRVRPLLRPGEFLGPVGRTTLSELMARSAVLLMPVEWEEAYGLVAAEAQMRGCPVVAYRRGALAEVVFDGTTGYLVAPSDEDALVAAIREARTLDRSQIRAWAAAQLGVERMIDDYDRAFREYAGP